MTLKPEHIVEELNRTPKLKRDLIMKMMEVMLDSEAFLEAYPTLYDPRIADVDLEYRKKVCEEMAQIIVRLFRKNKVRPDDAEKVLDRAREDYLQQKAGAGENPLSRPFCAMRGRQPSILCSTKSPTILSSWLTACSAPLAILRAVRRSWRWLVLVAMTPAAPSAAPAAMPIRSGAVELVCSFFIGGTPFESKFLGCEDSISA